MIQMGAAAGRGAVALGMSLLRRSSVSMLQPKDGDTSASVLACPRVSFKHDGCKMPPCLRQLQQAPDIEQRRGLHPNGHERYSIEH